MSPIDYRILMGFFRLASVHFTKKLNVSQKFKQKQDLLNILRAQNVQFLKMTKIYNSNAYLNSLFAFKNNQLMFSDFVKNNFFSTFQRFNFRICFTISLLELCLFSRKQNTQFNYFMQMETYFNGMSFIMPTSIFYASNSPRSKVLKKNNFFLAMHSFQFYDFFLFFFKSNSSKILESSIKDYWLFFLNLYW